METRTITLSIEEYSSHDELPAADRNLLTEAARASQSAYAPYSSFRVGAAVRLTNGTIVTGSNQENAAYPSGLCAERVALFYAQSHYPEMAVEALAIYASASDFILKEPVTPCGACRQVIAEYENRHRNPVRIIMASGDGLVKVVKGAETLLPMMFYLEELKKR